MDRSLNEVIHHLAQTSPSAIFLEDAGTDRQLTYAETWSRIGEWANGFAAAGVQRGDTVASVLPSSSEAVCSWLGLARLGAVEVPVNPAYKGELLRHVLEDSKAEVVLTDKPGLGGLADVAAHLTHLRLVVVLGADVAGSVGAVPAVPSEEFLARDAEQIEWSEAEARDVACILYTSGTTGPPKGAMVTWGQLYATAIGLPVYPHIGAVDAYYSPYPAFHIGGKHPPYLMALVGGRVVLKESFKTQDFWPDVVRHACTVSFLLSAMSQFLLAREQDDHERAAGLRQLMMVPLPDDVAAVEERFGCQVSTIFNMTEISVPIYAGPGDLVPGSCGRIRDGYSARIVDADDRELPPGEVGELVLRADQPWVHANGYWQAPERTVESWRNLWFHTGDAFRCDESGNYFFVDRIKDVIRRRGENIASFDIEHACLQVEGVSACAAVGVPSEYGEEDVLLLVVPLEENELKMQDLLAQLRARLPEFMVPAYIDFVTELPMTPTQKVRKAVLRKRGITPSAHRT